MQALFPYFLIAIPFHFSKKRPAIHVVVEALKHGSYLYRIQKLPLLELRLQSCKDHHHSKFLRAGDRKRHKSVSSWHCRVGSQISQQGKLKKKDCCECSVWPWGRRQTEMLPWVKQQVPGRLWNTPVWKRDQSCHGRYATQNHQTGFLRIAIL